MRYNLKDLFQSLPESLREMASISGQDLVLGRCEERERDNRPSIVLTGVPGCIAITSEGMDPRLIKTHEETVPTLLSHFAIDVGCHLGHHWAHNRAWRGDGLDVDRSWILALANSQMRPWLPGGVEIHDILGWDAESRAWQFRWSTQTSRLEVYAAENASGHVEFSIIVNRPNGNAFIVNGQYVDQKMIEVTTVSAGPEPIRLRHIMAAAELLRALDPIPLEDETWGDYLLHELNLPADLGDEG